VALLLADEDFPLPAVRRLRRLGHDVLTAGEAGLANRRVPDDIVLEYATRLGRAVLTYNWDDFLALHDRGVPHAGIVACEADNDVAALAVRVHQSLARRRMAGVFIEVRR
jgi:hypothetical protein